MDLETINLGQTLIFLAIAAIGYFLRRLISSIDHLDRTMEYVGRSIIRLETKVGLEPLPRDT